MTSFFQNVDVVLTARELARLIKMAGIDLRTLPDEEADSLLGGYTGAAPIFGRTGGVMEAALRTAITILSRQAPPKLEFTCLEGPTGIKRAEVHIGNDVIRVAVVHGLENAHKVCESVLEGGEFSKYHFIEFMTCPGAALAVEDNLYRQICKLRKREPRVLTVMTGKFANNE